MTPAVYINAWGKFLPGEPFPNDEMEAYLGLIHGKRSRARQRILEQNGIFTLHYLMDREERSLYSNAEMAARGGVDIPLER